MLLASAGRFWGQCLERVVSFLDDALVFPPITMVLTIEIGKIPERHGKCDVTSR